jgi:hypothetical protein
MPTEAERPTGPASDASMIELMQEALAALRGTIERVEWQGAQVEARAAAAEARADALRDHVTAMREQLADAHAALQAAAVADARTERAEQDKRRAEVALNAERARADVLRTTIDELKAGQALMVDLHARELAAAQQAAAELRQATKAGHPATGLAAWLRAAWWDR